MNRKSSLSRGTTRRLPRSLGDSEGNIEKAVLDQYNELKLSVKYHEEFGVAINL